jgi:hypothetical protein
VPEIEEAFMTWFEVELEGDQAIIHGKEDDLAVTVVAPTPAGQFRVEGLEQESRANRKFGVLKRITFTTPAARYKRVLIRFRMEIRKP